MLARLLSGILAVVFLPLGVMFSIVSGISLGAPLLAVGFVFAVVFFVLRRRELQRRGRRTLRATAEVIEARINHGVELRPRTTPEPAARTPT